MAISTSPSVYVAGLIPTLSGPSGRQALPDRFKLLPVEPLKAGRPPADPAHPLPSHSHELAGRAEIAKGAADAEEKKSEKNPTHAGGADKNEPTPPLHCHQLGRVVAEPPRFSRFEGKFVNHRGSGRQPHGKQRREAVDAFALGIGIELGLHLVREPVQGEVLVRRGAPVPGMVDHEDLTVLFGAAGKRYIECLAERLPLENPDPPVIPGAVDLHRQRSGRTAGAKERKVRHQLLQAVVGIILGLHPVEAHRFGKGEAPRQKPPLLLEPLTPRRMDLTFQKIGHRPLLVQENHQGRGNGNNNPQMEQEITPIPPGMTNEAKLPAGGAPHPPVSGRPHDSRHLVQRRGSLKGGPPATAFPHLPQSQLKLLPGRKKERYQKEQEEHRKPRRGVDVVQGQGTPQDRQRRIGKLPGVKLRRRRQEPLGEEIPEENRPEHERNQRDDGGAGKEKTLEHGDTVHEIMTPGEGLSWPPRKAGNVPAGSARGGKGP